MHAPQRLTPRSQPAHIRTLSSVLVQWALIGGCAVEFWALMVDADWNLPLFG